MAQFTPSTIGVYNGPRTMMEEWWRLCRRLRGGTTSMRIARTEYLPMTKQEEKDPTLYEKRLAKTRLLPAYDRAVQDLAALPFQHAPTIKGLDLLPKELWPIETNADRCGTSLWSFMSRIFEDAIDRGMGLFLVDNVPTTRADGSVMDGNVAALVDARPHFSRIHPDNLIGFVTEMRAGREVVTDLRRRETVTEMRNGRDTVIERVRHWTETDVELWERDTSQRQTQSGTDAMAAGSGAGQFRLIENPRSHGFRFGIPLIAVYTKKIGTLTAQPPLEDLAWENVAHWQSRSHQDDALSYCRAPILVGTGVEAEIVRSKPVLGAGATFMTTVPDTKLGFAEIAGSSLEAGERQLQKIEETCRWLAMQPLVQANGPETATGEVRADVREKAAAQKWTEGLEWAFYEAFEKLAQWAGLNELPEGFDLSLFRDFAILAPSANLDVPAMQLDVREGRMTLRTYLAEMVRRGKRAEDFDVDGEMEALDEQNEESERRRMEATAAMLKAEEDRAKQQPSADDAGGGNPPAKEQAA